MILNYEKFAKRIGKKPWGYNKYKFQVRGEKKIYEFEGTLSDVRRNLKTQIIKDYGLTYQDCTVDVL